MVPDAGNVQDWNRYGYVRHNPMIHTDPTGHVPILIPLAIIAAKVALKAAPVVVAGSAIAHRAAPAAQRAMVTAQRVASNLAVQDIAGDAAIGAGGELVQASLTGRTPQATDIARGAVSGVISNGMYRGATKNIANDYRLGALLQKSFHASASTGIGTFAAETTVSIVSSKSLDGLSVANALGSGLGASYIGPINPAVSRAAKFFGSKNERLNDALGEFSTRLLSSAVQNHNNNGLKQVE